MPETFPATYFSFKTRYPESGQRIQLGNSYQFDAPPTAPDQRLFTLSLQGMRYYLNANGTINATTVPARNMAFLEAFYNRHKRALEFILPHPVYGNVTCKFNTPLQIPDPLPGGGGKLPTFEVELIEIP